MSKQPKSHTGNTTSEYAIILGLIALASIGALSLMGNSLSSQIGKVNQGSSHQALAQMSNLNFDKPGSSGNGAAPAAPATGQNGYPLADVSNSGTNATSMDGNAVTALKSSYKMANKMLALAAQTDDPLLRAWYRATASDTFKLAGSQAAYELASQDITDPDNRLSKLIGIKNNQTIGEDDAVKSILTWQQSLQLQLSMLSLIRTASPAELKQAHDLAIGVLNANNIQYSEAINTTDISRAQVLNPDVAAIQKEAANTDAIDSIGLATSLETGAVMDQAAK